MSAGRYQSRVVLWYCLALVLMGPSAVPAADSTVTLLLGGDVMLSNWVTDHMDAEGTGYPFRAIDTVLASADIRFSNLETPIGMGDTTDRFEKTYTFALPARYRTALQSGGFDVVSLANNHLLDYGETLADSTVHYLREMGIAHTGYGKSLASAVEPAIVENGIRVGFLAYSMTFPREFWATDTSSGTAYPFEHVFVNRVVALDSVVDFTVVSFHWGGENSDSTKQYQQVFARQAIDAGADLIVGHHPHIWQGMEVYKTKLIAYSLGNLCFGSFSPTAIRSGLLEVTAARDSIVNARILPLDVENVRVRFQPRLLDESRQAAFLNHLGSLSNRIPSATRVRIDEVGTIYWEPKTEQTHVTTGR